LPVARVGEVPGEAGTEPGDGVLVLRCAEQAGLQVLTVDHEPTAQQPFATLLTPTESRVL